MIIILYTVYYSFPHPPPRYINHSTAQCIIITNISLVHVFAPFMTLTTLDTPTPLHFYICYLFLHFLVVFVSSFSVFPYSPRVVAPEPQESAGAVPPVPTAAPVEQALPSPPTESAPLHEDKGPLVPINQPVALMMQQTEGRVRPRGGLWP